MTVDGNLRQIYLYPTLCLLRCKENEHAKGYSRFKKSQEVSVLLHVPNQRYKRLKIKNGQNDRSGNSSVKTKDETSVDKCCLVE